MEQELEMLKQVFKDQLFGLANSYLLWITPKAHEIAEPVVKTFSFSLEKGLRRWGVAYIFTLHYHGRDIKVTFHSDGHDQCDSVDIDFADVSGVREQLAIISEFTYELYSQLLNYAKRNKFTVLKNVVT